MTSVLTSVKVVSRVLTTGSGISLIRASVARLSTAYARREIVGLREAWELHKGTREEALLEMLGLALGDPRPGDPVPRYQGKEMTYPLLLEIKQRVEFVAASLFMDLLDLHDMMRLVGRRAADAGEWQAINLILEKAGKARHGDPTWRLNPSDPRAFAANLAKALDGAPDLEREGLREVRSLEDLHEQRIRDDVRAFIRDKLFLSEQDFSAMMLIKLHIDRDWWEIDRILEQAGRRKRNHHPHLAPGHAARSPQADHRRRRSEQRLDRRGRGAQAHASLPGRQA